MEVLTIENLTRKMHSGELYSCDNQTLMSTQAECIDKVLEYNQIPRTNFDKRTELLKQMFCEIGEDCYIEAPFFANWGGKHVHFGKRVYANFNLTLVDDTHIYVGDYTMFAPNVTVVTGTHPICPELREQSYQYNKPVHIGKNCWIGTGSIILPGITIGDNSVIGAGSVVTKDVPSGVVAFGNPCRVIRQIDDNDRKIYDKDKAISPDFF